MTEVLSPKQDRLNRKRTRNAENTDEFDYNCGGYALETYSWYLPYRRKAREDHIFDLHYNGCSEEEIVETILEEDCAQMIKDFGGALRRITPSDFSTIENDEEIVAYRIFIRFFFEEDGEGTYLYSIEHDFHYRVLRRGKWMDKMGDCDIEESEGELFDPWNFEYDSRIIFFARRIS